LELQLEKKRESEREREVHYLGEEFLYFLVYSLGIVLASILRKFLLGFLPHEGFPG